MSVLSFWFVLFVLGALLVYYLTPGKYQWVALLVVSYVFYLFAGVWALLFILTTTVTTYFAGRYLGKVNNEFDEAVANYSGPNRAMTRAEKKALKEKQDKRKRKIVVLVLILNFGILIVLKYINPIVSLFTGICGLFGLQYTAPYFSMIVPLGISYYTFQAMGYLIDLYRRKFGPEKNFARFMLFISFFPQLIQGPISRYDEFSTELFTPHKYSFDNIRSGLELAVWGLFKKLVISDRIAIITMTILGSPDTYGGFYLVAATFLSMIQLYTDFSGGIDITRGVAECFGVHMPENFVRPFFSDSFSEYWRRWHITLNNWWRDYIFYPMTLSKPFQKMGKRMRKVVGQNFSKKLPILIAIIIIRVINSIWHGATSVSILVGLYYGLVLALSFYFEPGIKKLTKKLKINTECFSWKLFQCLRTFVIVAAPRFLLSATTLPEAGNYIKNMFTVYNPWIFVDQSFYNLGVDRAQMGVLFMSLLVLLLVSALGEKGYNVRETLHKQNVIFRGLIYLLFIVAIVLFGVYGAGYDSSAFIYQQI